jgi:hypothetical protein
VLSRSSNSETRRGSFAPVEIVELYQYLFEIVCENHLRVKSDLLGLGSSFHLSS